MDLGLNGKTALVTGASKGIGFGIAKALAGDGATVAISSRSAERIEAAAAEIGARGYAHDNSDIDGLGALVDRVEADLGPIDVLVTSTGGPPGGEPLGLSRDEWLDAYRDLMLAPMALIERVLPGMRERGFGRVVNVGSSSVREPIPPLMLSNSIRPGVAGAFKTLARQYAGDGVTFNHVLPGRIATDRLASNYGSLETAEEVAKEEIPTRRLGRVEEIADAAAFLCSERASYITGIALLVDGGLTRSI